MSDSLKNILWILFLASMIVACFTMSCRADYVELVTNPAVCRPCRAVEPLVDSAIRDGYRIRKVKLNEGQNQQYAEAMGIAAIPCFIYFAETPYGKYEVARTYGYMSDTQIRQFCRTPVLTTVLAPVNGVIRSVAGGIPIIVW